MVVEYNTFIFLALGMIRIIVHPMQGMSCFHRTSVISQFTSSFFSYNRTSCNIQYWKHSFKVL